MSATLAVVQSAEVARPDREPQVLEEQLRERVESILVDDRIVVAPNDPVGGGAACGIPDCPRSQYNSGLCTAHFDRWRLAGRPDRSRWEPGAVPSQESVSLRDLPTPLRWEFAYGVLRAREQPGVVETSLKALRTTLGLLARAKVSSLLQYPEDRWPAGRHANPVGRLRTEFLMFTIDEIDRLCGQFGREEEFKRDVWRLRRVGFAETHRSWFFDFRDIDQPWLREAVKKFLRWRVDTGHSVSGMHRDLRTLGLLARAMAEQAGPDARPDQFDRAVITRFLTLLTEQVASVNGRSQRLSSASRFLTVARQHNWIPGVPARTALYIEDFPRRPELAPRALSSLVMAQLEGQDNLDKLADPRWRLLFPLLMETGLRINDALHLPLDCVVHDQHQAPYLRYHNRKMKRDAMVPISADVAAAIAAQCQRVLAEYSPKAMLFPRERRNPDGTRPVGVTAVRSALQNWLEQCQVVDESGAPAHITLHQFRHTLGTRLINNDVPQEVVRKLLDHTSVAMTAHYARLHDSTVRKHWERARKVDIHGNDVTVTPDSPLADAEWTKHHLARATMALSNGYCGLPLQQSCPHANACLTCPVFITTPEFLSQHQEQLKLTRGIIERARERGQLRLAEMNQRTADNLLTIITSLEHPSSATEPGSSDAS